MQRLMIVDLEATCDRDGWTGLDMMETIEIGAVIIELDAYKTIAEYQSFVRPKLNPILTPFCTELTTIQQEDVDNAPFFSEAFAKLCQFSRKHRIDAWASWGFYDLKQFKKDCERNGMELDLPVHVNMKHCFTKARGTGKHLGMKAAMEILDLTLDGTHHRGIDDARNMAKTVFFIKPTLMAAYDEALKKQALA